MRIAHVVLQARFSGAEILARDLAVAEAAKGNQLAFVSLEPSSKDFHKTLAEMRDRDVAVFQPGSLCQNGVKRAVFLRHFLRSWHPDAIFAHSILPSIYSRAANIAGSKCRIFSVLHSNGDLADWKLRLAEHVLAHRNEAVIGVSQLACENYRRAIRTSRPVIHIPNGIDLNRFRFRKACRSAKRAELGLQDTSVNVLQVGRLCEQKQQLAAIEACQIVNRTTGRPVHLSFVGTCDEGSEYARRVGALVEKGDGSVRISYLGGRSDVAHLLSAFDVSVMPSAWEAHSIAAIEAAASGIPLVLSDIDDFRKFEAVPGIRLFRLGDNEAFAAAISAAMNDRQRFRRMLNHYAIDKCVQRYGALLQDAS